MMLPMILLALPKPILADKYLMGAKTSIDNKDHQSANEYFEKIVQLDIELPDEFYFQYGKNSLQLKDYNKSLKYINLYLEKAGNTGKYYRDALLMSNQSEEGLKEKQLRKERWEQFKAREEERKREEAAIPRYSLTILPTPPNAKVQIAHIKDVYKDGIRLKRGTYTIKVSKKGYKDKRVTIELEKDIRKSIKLTKIKPKKKKVKKATHVWHCTAKSVRASGWAESTNYSNARSMALNQCNKRRQTSTRCRVTNCYKIR